MGCSLTERWTSRWPFRGRRPPLLRASCNVLGAGSDAPRAVATSGKAASEGGPSEQGGREVSASSSTLRAGGRPLFPPSDPSPQKKSAATTRAGLALGGGAPSPFEKPARGSHRLQPLPRHGRLYSSPARRSWRCLGSERCSAGECGAYEEGPRLPGRNRALPCRAWALEQGKTPAHF